MLGMVRRYLLTNDTIANFVSEDGVANAIFREGKPKVDIDNYIILKERPLDLGVVRTYQLEVVVFSKDIDKLIEIEEEVESMLNDVRGNKKYIEGERFIRSMTMLTGGGRQFDESLDRWVGIRYYRIIL